jgi:tRNA G18 (ribose-2'-O)-methylase SpoU
VVGLGCCDVTDRVDGDTPEDAAHDNDAEIALPLVGVGPWPGGPAEWARAAAADARLDPQLLESGDSRNVLDRYRYWTVDAIVADLDEHRHDFHVAIENLEHDMNIGSIVRTANACAARMVHIIGRRKWNRRGAMVTERYQHVMHHANVEDFLTWARAQDLPIIGIDIFEGSVPLETFVFPRSCVLFFGQEGPGLSEEALSACSAVASISQFGSTRSINVGAAAAIAMHAWIRQHVFQQTP